MAWNQPGKGGNGPWRKPSGGGLGSVQDRLRDWFGGPAGGGLGPLAWIGGALAVLVLFNSFKLIDEKERGVVLRFGAYHRVMGPGANFKFPWPIESVTVVESETFQSLEDQVRVLTKDENIVDVRFNVQYKIKGGDENVRAFLFGFRDDSAVGGPLPQGRETLTQAAESAVREVVGNSTMDVVLLDRTELITEAKRHLQETLDLYGTGIEVRNFTLQSARPPDEVRQAFDDAISAREDKNRVESEARAYASKVVPEARGQAARVLAEANGYRSATIAKSEGDARRFSQLAAEYRKAPEVTRKRLYLETMQQVLSLNRKVIAERDNNILYLPMDGGASSPASAAPLLPAVRANTAPPAVESRPERAPRGDGREEGR
jgi:membrane protease subunit HflK